MTTNLNEILSVSLLVVSSLTFIGLIFWNFHTQKDHKKHKKA